MKIGSQAHAQRAYTPFPFYGIIDVLRHHEDDADIQASYPSSCPCPGTVVSKQLHWSSPGRGALRLARSPVPRTGRSE